MTDYIGYTVANQGFREGERKGELLYSMLVYGLIGWLVFYCVLMLWRETFFTAMLAAVSAC
ncbi:hypothetical protein [Microbulbifer sp. 2205BS26-8]|uniref:hypothetical protein n=1 Tax=Microbulbifer sp. 2205BS26-8 TaxID=3064386 RepID=UPI00273EF2FD|nr:hypothetical protein [Microbulbifer sp. 2205BS26-8]MDP5210835.1 hypothetical protein [Microbulbifer sp. 2205BS26-8]